MNCPSEARLQDFVDGRAVAEELAILSEHLDGCADCRALLGAIQPVRDGEEPRIGRYLLRGTLGQGGMGVVYEAFDPELDRVVALKLLRPELGSEKLQARLVTEAQAMAKLSHPHVVSVYDIGRSADSVFIVMDLVDGTSLRHRTAMGLSSLGEALQIFAQAGRGLAAAHAAGLVHRDFKPENVLIARDGRVLVSDFGLALSDVGSTDAATLSQEGSPAYMAPEQRDGSGFDARSDQFSFCLALREAALATPEGTRLPGWLSRVIGRGLSRDPGQRFPSMEALLAALERGRGRGRALRIGMLLGATCLVLGGVTFWAGMKQKGKAQLCSGGAARIASIWSPAIAERLLEAFTRTQSPLSATAWKDVHATLDSYASAWAGAHARTCEATSVRGEQSELLLDKKMSCLEERRQLLSAVVALLEHVDIAMIERVPSVLQILQPVAGCESLTEQSPTAPPPLAEQALEVETARRAVARAAAAVSAGRYQEGLTLAKAAATTARASRYLPVEAEASLWLGIAEGRLGHPRESEVALEQAVSSASAGHAEVIAVRAWIQLMHFIGFEAHRPSDGLRYNDYAEAALRSLPGGAELDVERLSWLSAMLVADRRLDEALAASQRQRALVEAKFGTGHRLYAAALDGIAGILALKGKAGDAITYEEGACGVLEHVLGDPHPQVALCLNNLGGLHAALGQHTVAITIKQRALAMFAQLPGHPTHVAMTHRNLARSYLELGQLDKASAELEASLTDGKSETDALAYQRLHGDLLRERGLLRDAMREHASVVERTRDAEPARQLEPLLALAESYEALGSAQACAATAARARAIAEALYSPTSYKLAVPLRLEAIAQLALRHPTEAIPLGERALAVLNGAEVDPLLRARVQLTLAQALATQPATHARARSLATSARSLVEQAHPAPRDRVAIDAFIARHRPTGRPDDGGPP